MIPREQWMSQEVEDRLCTVALIQRLNKYKWDYSATRWSRFHDVKISSSLFYAFIRVSKNTTGPQIIYRGSRLRCVPLSGGNLFINFARHLQKQGSRPISQSWPNLSHYSLWIYLFIFFGPFFFISIRVHLYSQYTPFLVPGGLFCIFVHIVTTEHNVCTAIYFLGCLYFNE